MFRLRIFILLGWFVTAPSLSADLPTAVEPDKRLQSEGKGWRLEKAQVINSERPRILLIGDSILNGYARQVIKKLNGRAYIDMWVNPYHQSKNLNEVLERVLSQGPYEPVAFPVLGSTGVTLIFPPFSFGNSTATGGVVAVIGLRGLAPLGEEPTFFPGLTVGTRDGVGVISTSSISKISVEFGRKIGQFLHSSRPLILTSSIL